MLTTTLMILMGVVTAPPAWVTNDSITASRTRRLGRTANSRMNMVLAGPPCVTVEEMTVAVLMLVTSKVESTQSGVIRAVLTRTTLALGAETILEGTVTVLVESLVMWTITTAIGQTVVAWHREATTAHAKQEVSETVKDTMSARGEGT